MAEPIVSRKTLYLIIVIALTLLWVVGTLLAGPSVAAPTLVIRALALAGYFFIFLAILSSAYLRELVKAFGWPFIKVHHIASITGLVAIGLHPVAVAIDYRTASVFAPKIGTLTETLAWLGRPAWYLLLIAALTAFLRARMGNIWRAIHYVNYIAFLAATVHANLMGGNFSYTVPRVISIVMVAAVIAVFIWRRIQAAKRPARARK